jgi:predicted nucleic acid-binding protein
VTFADIPAGISVFLDANTLVYHFADDPQYGPPCTRLMKRIERKDVIGLISADALSDTAHRLMTLEAILLFGWPAAGIAHRLRRHCAEISKLARFRQAVEEVPLLGIHVLPITLPEVLAAATLSSQHQLLSADALIVAVMQAHGLSAIASNDSDFDKVPGLTRYAP